MKRFLSVLLVFLLMLPSAGFAFSANLNRNPSDYLALPLQSESLDYLINMGGGMIYRMDYAADYMLDEVLARGAVDLESLISFVQAELLKEGLAPVECSFNGSGVAFSAPGTLGAKLLCTGYNAESSGPFVAVNTTMNSGYVSLSLADAGIIGYTVGSLSDGSTDISMAVAFPYLVSSGFNENGLGVALLGESFEESETESDGKDFFPGIAIRLLLDRADSIKSAISLLEEKIQPLIDGKGFRLFLTENNSNSSTIISCSTSGVDVSKLEYAAFDGPVPDGSDALSPKFDSMSAVNETSSTKALVEILSTYRLEEIEDSPLSSRCAAVLDLTRFSMAFASDNDDYEKIFYIAYINDASC